MSRPARNVDEAMVDGRSSFPSSPEALLVIAPRGTQIRVCVERVKDEVLTATNHLHELQVIHHGEVAMGHEVSNYHRGMA